VSFGKRTIVHYTIMNNQLVTVVIPIYKSELTAYEAQSLQQCCKVLGTYAIVLVKPQTLDVTNLLQQYPELQIESFDDSYFGSILGYNRLMLSAEFYERFLNSKYLLIYQLDAYVFKDELTAWCNRGFDYVGAPWTIKKKYENPIYKPVLAIKSFIYKLKGKPSRYAWLGNKVGNGGLSLRKVDTHLKAVQNRAALIEDFLKKSEQHTEFNEDVFFATQVDEFLFPSSAEALQFSFDLHPKRCFALNNEQLPFGCHGWYKGNRLNFWSKYIFSNN
jgi:hypothetical protein